MLGLGWEQHFKRIVRELIALTYVLDSCCFQLFCFLFCFVFFSFFVFVFCFCCCCFFSLSPFFFPLLVLIGAVLVTGVPVWPGATWECYSVLKRRGSRPAAFVWTSSREKSISSRYPELSDTRAYQLCIFQTHCDYGPSKMPLNLAL